MLLVLEQIDNLLETAADFDSLASVTIFARLHYPHVIVGIFALVLSEYGCKPLELFVLGVEDVECHRDVPVLLRDVVEPVVVDQVVKQCLLITQVVVALEVVLHWRAVRKLVQGTLPEQLHAAGQGVRLLLQRPGILLVDLQIFWMEQPPQLCLVFEFKLAVQRLEHFSDCMLLGLVPAPFFLPVEIGIDLTLGPSELGFGGKLVSGLPPPPLLHQAADQVGVVASPHEVLVLHVQLAVESG